MYEPPHTHTGIETYILHTKNLLSFEPPHTLTGIETNLIFVKLSIISEPPLTLTGIETPLNYDDNIDIWEPTLTLTGIKKTMCSTSFFILSINIDFKYLDFYLTKCIIQKIKETILNTTMYMEEHKMNQQQKKETRKLPSFYIALCCCVLAIGIAGYFTERHNSDSSSMLSNEIADNSGSEVFSDSTDKFTSSALNVSEDETQEASSANVEESSEVVSNTETAQSTDTQADIPVMSEQQVPVEDYAVNNPDVDQTAVIVSSEQPAFIMPVNGNTLEGYSDKLKYNEQLSDWRTHNGIDIAANTGCSVQAAADGVIDETGKDAMGEYVIISHAAGFITKYMGLENIENLTVGKEIKSGEVIGTSGKCTGENVTDPHIHFEMSKDGVLVNPTDYLPQQ